MIEGRGWKGKDGKAKMERQNGKKKTDTEKDLTKKPTQSREAHTIPMKLLYV